MAHCFESVVTRLFSTHQKSKRRMYEKLPTEDTVGLEESIMYDDEKNDEKTSSPVYSKKNNKKLRSCALVSLSLALFFLLGHLLWKGLLLGWKSSGTATTSLHVHKERIPTFLSLRDNNGHFVYALDNPIYDKLGEATLYNNNNLQSILISTNVSSTSLKRGDSLTLQWTTSSSSSIVDEDALQPTNNRDNENGVRPSDIWVLYCGEEDYGNDDETAMWRFENIYEVATVSQVVTESSSDFSSSSWYIPNFPMSHRQEACQFVLYREEEEKAGGAVEWYALTSSPRIDTLKAVTTPTALHLAFTQDPTRMVIQFISGQQAGTTTPIVAYANASSPSSKWINGRVPGTSTTYEATDLCMAPANETGPGKFQSPGLLHTVELTDLKPNTKYVYKAGIQHGQGVTWSDMASFTTAPADDDNGDDSFTYPFSYLVYADQGCPENGWGQGSAWTAAVVAKEIESNATIRMVHHFGDLSYARGASHQWDAWMEMVEPISKNVPYHISVGNHEYDYTAGGADKDPTGNVAGYFPEWGNFGDDSGGECGVPVSKRFRMPASPGGVFWYAHNFANVHTIVLSSENDLAPGSAQFKWLVHDLAHVNRTATPWVIVEIHRPLYEGEAKWDQNDVGIALRMELEHALHDYNVDLVLGGHYHAYHRTCDGLYMGRCDRGGPMHITVGTAGAALDEDELFDNVWSVVYIKKVFGYGRMTVYNSTDLLFEFVQGAAVENDPDAGQTLDTVWIHRERS